MTTSAPVPIAQRPIGVFDSGIGGLSILRALRAELPHEDVVYVADSAYAPYGERDEAQVRERALRITQDLIDQHHIKALVVACNTATAVAIAELRALHPALPIVGVEPALKPAAAQSRTHRVGVLATRATLSSAKYRALQASLQNNTTFVDVPCDGLAAAIEADHTEEIARLCQHYMHALGPIGQEHGEIDTIVLGCTHYPFASKVLNQNVACSVDFLESGAPVARQTRRLLEAAELLNTTGGELTVRATGSDASLRWALSHWLN
jgi:glutamate racemase